MAAAKKEEEPVKVEIVSPLKAEPSKEEKSVLQAQADQMYGNAKFHAPDKPKRADENEEGKLTSGAPVAQGPNISKEEAEFAANAKGKVPEEKTPASTEVK